MINENKNDNENGNFRLGIKDEGFNFALQISVIGVFAQLGADGMVLVSFEGNGQGGGVGLGDDALVTHYIYYIGDEVAVEGGVLLFAGVSDEG